MTPNCVKSLYLIINNKNGYVEEGNENKYLTLIPTYKSKNKMKKYEEIWNKTKDLIRLRKNNSHDYAEEQRKTKLNVFNDDKKYNPQVFLHAFLYKLTG